MTDSVHVVVFTLQMYSALNWISLSILFIFCDIYYTFV